MSGKLEKIGWKTMPCQYFKGLNKITQIILGLSAWYLPWLSNSVPDMNLDQ